MTSLMQVSQRGTRCASCDRAGGAAVAVQGRHCRVHGGDTQPCSLLRYVRPAPPSLNFCNIILSYELSKKTFKGSGHGNKIFGDMLAGACATVVHDAIVTPLDVVKQRMQLFNSRHTGVLQTIKSVYAQSGIKGFYASYPVTLAMNVPHFSLYFATYEQTKRLLQGAPSSGDSCSSQFTPATHCVAGAAAGLSSSLVRHSSNCSPPERLRLPHVFASDIQSS